jgi:linoleoyl-CoA desaturase
MAKVTFNNRNNQFFQSLKKDIDAYFQEKGIKKTGNSELYAKTLVLLPLSAACYLLLMLAPVSTAMALTLIVILGLALASIGFNVMHDACHGSYSSKKWVNNLLGYSLNAIGGNCFFWKLKHNVIHHTYTNIEGIDDDIAQSRLLRQSPTQEWLPVHRYQHIYLTLAYSLTLFMWVGLRDFEKYVKRKVYKTQLPPMDMQEHIIFWVSKFFYVITYIVIPIMVWGWQSWLVGYLMMNVIIGIVISYVFQLAHAVEGPEFDSVGLEPKQIENEWAVHQIRTTANFAPDNKFINWYVGGLNYQVEHHLFPRISHVHYPAISHIVRKKCEEFGLPYHCFPTLWAAVESHVKTMKKLGQKPDWVVANQQRA